MASTFGTKRKKNKYLEVLLQEPKVTKPKIIPKQSGSAAFPNITTPQKPMTNVSSQGKSRYAALKKKVHTSKPRTGAYR